MTGFWGAGKSTLGRSLAQRLGVPFIDLDRWIVRQTGMSLRQLVDQEGLKYFRNYESKALAMHLVLPPFAVVSLGGGTLLRESNLQLVKQKGVLVHLKVSLEKSWRRLQRQRSNHRLFLPSTARSPRDLRSMYEVRSIGYKSADVTVETENRPQEDCTNEIIDYLVEKHLFMWEEKFLWMAN